VYKKNTGVLNFIKGKYVLVFKFIIGDEKRKFYIFFTHMVTIMCIFLIPCMYIYVIIQIIISREPFNIEYLGILFGLPAATVLLPCMAKLLVYISRWL